MDVKCIHAAIPAVLVASFVTTPAVAAPDEPPEMSANALEYLISRPHTIMELEGGIIALPGKSISNAQRGGDTPIGRVGRGDATMQAGAHVLYRFNKNYVVGAGVIFSPFGTSDDQYGGGYGQSRGNAKPAGGQRNNAGRGR